MKLRRTVCRPLAAAFGVMTLLATSGAAAMATPTLPAARQLPKTVTVNVRPVDNQGKLNNGYTVTKTLRGATCGQESEFVSEAWRCFAGNDILDPCWAESGGAPRVACPLAPWAKTVWRLDLSAPLVSVTPYSSQPAWGIELESGNRCGFAEGATNVVDGQRLNYACQKNDVWLLGWIARKHKPWQIRTGVETGDGFVLGPERSIKVVWRALPAVYK